jgi:adenosylhomocysteine nucleosidase
MNSINISGQNKILVIVALPMELPIASWGARSKIVYSGVGKINTSINLIDAIRIYKPALVVNLGTSGSLNSRISGVVEVHTVIERDFDAYLEQMGVDIVDMELIAIARVCKKYNIPWRSFKFISDYIGRNIDEPWQDEVMKASKALIEKFDAEFF